MTNTPSTQVRRLAGAALAALVTLLTLTLVAPATAHAAGETASVSPSTAAAGEAVTVSGSGFQPGEAVEVWYGGPAIASGVADANGDFSVSGSIPAGMPEGGHPMDVVGSMGSMVSFSYTVVAPPTPPSPTPPTPAPSAPATPAPTGVSPTVGTGSADDGAETDTVADLDDTELALAETSADDVTSSSSAKAWGLVIVILALAGLVVCTVALRRAEREQD